MPIKLANNLQSRIADVGGLPIGAMSFSLQAGDGAKLLARIPDLGTNGVFVLARMKNVSAQRETVKVASVVGDVCTVSERAVEPEDVERAFAQNDVVHFVLTAAGLQQIKTDLVSDIIFTNIVSSNESIAPGTSQITFTGLVAGNRYRLEFELYQTVEAGAAFGIGLRFGNSGGIDSGQNYSGVRESNPSPSTFSVVTLVAQTAVDIGVGGNDPSSALFGNIEFSTRPGALGDREIVGRSEMQIPTENVSNRAFQRVHFSYVGAAVVDRVQIFPNSFDLRTFEGHMRLIRLT